MAKKKRKKSAAKKSARNKTPPKMPPKMAHKGKKRHGKPRGVPPSPTKIPGAATSRFVNDVMAPASVELPVPIDIKTGGTGQGAGKRLVKITGAVGGPSGQQYITVSTPLARGRGGFLPYL
jgi:hypothetical protein